MEQEEHMQVTKFRCRPTYGKGPSRGRVFPKEEPASRIVKELRPGMARGGKARMKYADGGMPKAKPC